MMLRSSWIYVLYLICFSHSTSSSSSSSKSMIVHSRKSTVHVRCPTDHRIQINLIRYRFHQFNCTTLHQDPSTYCLDRSSCQLDFVLPLQSSSIRCNRTKLKDLEIHYTCQNRTSINVHFASFLIWTLLSLMLIISMVIFGLFYFNRCYYQSNVVDDQRQNETPIRIIVRDASMFETNSCSSGSTITSMNSRTLNNDPSEYDNLMKINWQER